MEETSMDKIKLLTGLVVATLVLSALSFYGTFSLLSLQKNLGASVAETAENSDSGPSPTQPSPKPTPTPSTVQVSVDDDPAKGSASAPVTIIEFSDFECPFCSRFYSNTLDQIDEEYIKTGKVRFVYRDFPLSGHRNAQKAAEGAECADEQGKFWEMHDKIFDNQRAMTVPDLKQYAQELGLNTAQFNDCLDSGKMAEEVQKDYQDGLSYGVTGTPGFFVNGIPLKGAQPFSAFQQIIEQELNK